MSRLFGWDLPPGCTMRDIDEQAGVGEICEVCGYVVEKCICAECPVCSENGNPNCYGDTVHAHGLEKSKEQQIGYAKRQIAELKDQIADHEQFIAWAEDNLDKKKQEDW